MPNGVKHSGVEIPEDLRRVYTAAKIGHPFAEPTPAEVVRYIERIAKAEADRDRLLEALKAPLTPAEALGFSAWGKERIIEIIAARAAIAASGETDANR